MITAALAQRLARVLGIKRGSSGEFSLTLTMQQILFYTFPHLILTDALQAAVNVTSFH